MHVIKKMPFGVYSHKFAILGFNSILVRNSILPIIFYTYPALSLFELIDSGLTIDCVKDIVMQMFEKSIEYNTSHEVITPKELEEELKGITPELKEKFGVEELFITGSYANGLYNEYSDLDLIVKMEFYELLSDLKKFLINKLPISVDCIRYDDPFTQYEDLVKYRIKVV